MASVIYRLPEALVQTILQDWVGLSDVCRLDSALCNAAERAHFTHLVHKPDFVLHETCFSISTKRYTPDKLADLVTEWIVFRDISTSVIVLSPYITNYVPERVRYLMKHGTHVHEIRMVHYAFDLVGFARAMRDLCACCPDVTAVVFAVQDVLSKAVVELIASSWTKLSWLNLGRLESKVDLSPIAQNCQVLEKLECFFTVPSHRFQQRLWRDFFSVCPATLRIITLRSKLEPTVLKLIAARCPLLQELSVGLGLADDEALVALAAGCPHVNQLSLINNNLVTAMGVTAIARNRALVKLNFYNTPGMTDEAMVAIAEHSPLLEDVRGDSGERPVLTDTTLVALGRHCPKLQSLWLTRFRNFGITEAGFQAIAVGCQHLERFFLDGGEYDAGDGVVTLAEHCRRLRLVRLSDVPAEGVLALAEHCPLLESADLSGQGVTDDTITALVQRCPAIWCVVLKDTSVTERGLRAIAAHSKRLRTILFQANILGKGRAEEVRALFAASIEVVLTGPAGEIYH